MPNNVDPDETAHDESYLELPYLQQHFIIAYCTERVNNFNSDIHVIIVYKPVLCYLWIDDQWGSFAELSGKA